MSKRRRINPSLHSPSHAKLLADARREQADAMLRDSRRAGRPLTTQIGLAFRRENWRGRFCRSIWPALDAIGPQYREPFRAILNAAAEANARAMLARHEYVRALGRLATWRACWIRPAAGWTVRTHNAQRQFSSLARHLLARYPVPCVFDAAFMNDDESAAAEWFIHVGAGQNLRTAAGLPFPLTKMMAHHAMLADESDVNGVVAALRWGQVRGLGGSARLANAVAASRLRAAQGPDAELFWLTVVQFLVNHGAMLDPQQVGPIVDFLHAQRFVRGPARVEGEAVVAGEVPQPNLSMKGRTVESLLRQMQAWHRLLAREARAGARIAAAPTKWRPSGIDGYERVEGTPGNKRRFRVVELLDANELAYEGRAMRHCVASYAYSCAGGRCAIFSLREEVGGAAKSVRRLTVEVSVPTRRIVQARGPLNAPPGGLEERILRAWATTARLILGAGRL